MIISITSLKGGVGKSTLAQNIAVCLAHSGYKVAIIDTDENASSVHWSGLRSEDSPPVPVFGISDAEALRKTVNTVRSDYEVIIIDGTPALSKLVTNIILLGDVVLIPIRPGGMDIWASQKFLERYEMAQQVKPEIKGYFVLNQYNDAMIFNRQARTAIEEMGIQTMQSSLKSRIAYAEASVQGRGVYEYRDPKAAAEIVALTNELTDILNSFYE